MRATPAFVTGGDAYEVWESRLNPSTAQARVLVDELVRNGVRHAVLCPGSRNAPLSFALDRAARAGRLELHVRIDERSAAFLALGLAERTEHPVPVVCTSGTAAANFHPAVLEAAYAGLPLLLLTADRPPEMHERGANQTVEQVGLFGRAAASVDFPVAERRAGQQARWRSSVCRAYARATGALDGRRGPVQVNLPYREPLTPDVNAADEGADWPEALDGRPGGRPWSAVPGTWHAEPADEPALDDARTLVVAGHGTGTAAGQLAGQYGWPVIAEPYADCWGWPGTLAAGPLLLGVPELPDRLRPERVVVLGRPTLHRPVQNLLARSDLEIVAVADGAGWTDVAGTAHQVRRQLPPAKPAPQAWSEAWRWADERAQRAVSEVLADEPWPNGPAVAAEVVDALPEGSALVLGSSNPVRDVGLAARPRRDLHVVSNRGVAGIDGTVSTAAGVALAHSGPGTYAGSGTYALLGDLTFLHDTNGLLIGPEERRPDLTIVVCNDDGGGIFSLLEQGGQEYRDSFERVFATGHGTRLDALCAAHDVPYTAATTAAELRQALRPAPGTRVVEVRTDRDRLRDLHARLSAAVANAV